MIPERKVCGRCNIEKKGEEFPKRIKGDGKYVWLRLQCYECMREIYAERYAKNSKIVIQRNKMYAEKNKDAVLSRGKIWRHKNKEIESVKRKERYANTSEIVKQRRREYYLNNKEKVIAANKKYEKCNLAKIRQRQRNNHNKRKEQDLDYVLIRKLRGRVLSALKNNYKGDKTRKLIGCDIDFLKNHLENKFTEGMTWENIGFWQIDHIRPCASYDLGVVENQRLCFNYKNLQPLWAVDNNKKSSFWNGQLYRKKRQKNKDAITA